LDKLKKISCFIIILIFLLTFASCQREAKNISTEIEFENGETGILANNNAVDFYFYYPENLILDKNAAMISVYANDAELAESSMKDPFTGETFEFMLKPNLSVTEFILPDNKYETVDEYWKELGVPSFETIFQDIKIEADEDLTVDGISAKKYTYSCSLSGIVYKVSHIIFINKHKVFTLTYTASDKNYDKYINILNTAAETFKFK